MWEQSSAKPPLEDRLAFIGNLLGSGVGGFTEAFGARAAVQAAQAAHKENKLKDINADEVLYFFTWPYRFEGKADCGLALGANGGCIWSPGALYGTDVRSFRYGTTTGLGADVWWALRAFRYSAVGFYAAPDTPEGMVLLKIC